MSYSANIIEATKSAKSIKKGGFQRGVYIDTVEIPDENDKWVQYCRRKHRKIPGGEVVKATLITSNQRKIEEAQSVFSLYGLNIDAQALDIDEIQHHDPIEISRAKARSAFRSLSRPVLINDCSWSIPSLNGFPGGYMKDIMQWFTVDDFLALMASKKDRSIKLSDVTVYYDGKEMKEFTTHWHGEFLHKPVDFPGDNFHRLVVNKDTKMSIAEEHCRRDIGHKDKMYEGPWADCAQWLKEKLQ